MVLTDRLPKPAKLDLPYDFTMSRKMMVNFNKLCLLVLLSTVVYNEFICFYLAYLSWPRVAAPDTTSSVVLFIADPQIQGALHEPPGTGVEALT